MMQIYKLSTSYVNEILQHVHSLTEIANQLKRKMEGVSRISIDYLQNWLVINEYG
jgi:hypothetical protein